ncbi:MAG: hemin ABC transporter substrate-binding protein [Hyphomicrobiales bacterium]|nr:MAG: hemin ABC transporter substrate-binding protein [Hyphomicrobiales bacterium]
MTQRSVAAIVRRAARAATVISLLSMTTANAVEINTSEARRIVSVGGAITEIVYALGQENRLAGIDTTSFYPPQALQQKPNVGYMRQLSAEGVLGLNPDLILATEGSGPKETISILKEAKVPIVSIPEHFSESGLIERVEIIAKQLGVENSGKCLIDAVKSDINALHVSRDKIGERKRVMFVMSLAGGRAMVAGRNTAADQIIAMSGGTNPIDAFDGYKQLNDEAIIAARPDVILTMERGSGTLSSEAVFGNPGLALTPAAANKAFIAMDGHYLLGFGPRTAAAARDLALTLYPMLSGSEAERKSSVVSANCSQ